MLVDNNFLVYNAEVKTFKTIISVFVLICRLKCLKELAKQRTVNQTFEVGVILF